METEDKRIIKLSVTEQDDSQFVALVERIFNETIRTYEPRELYLIQIDTWFDHKWYNFPGRSCCQDVYFSPLVPPPFIPKRVMSQLTYMLSDTETLVFDSTKAPDLHIHQSSPDNSHRRLKDITPSGLYLWYSSNTVKIDRASLMVYSVEGEDNLGWYASFLNRGEWKIGLTKGISKQEILHFARG